MAEVFLIEHVDVSVEEADVHAALRYADAETLLFLQTMAVIRDFALGHVEGQAHTEVDWRGQATFRAPFQSGSSGGTVVESRENAGAIRLCARVVGSRWKLENQGEFCRIPRAHLPVCSDQLGINGSAGCTTGPEIHAVRTAGHFIRRTNEHSEPDAGGAVDDGILRKETTDAIEVVPEVIQIR